MIEQQIKSAISLLKHALAAAQATRDDWLCEYLTRALYNANMAAQRAPKVQRKGEK